MAETKEKKMGKSLLEKIIVNPISSKNVAAIQRTPQTILSKEQNMLNELFGQKRQFWGNGQPVQINNTLTSGNGLIKNNDGGETGSFFGIWTKNGR